MTRVEVVRGDVVESVHRVHVAVADATGRLRAFAGSPDRVVFARSAVKPVQAMPLVEDGVADRFGFGARELALCCSSHSGEDRHVEAALAMLRRIGLDESALACGAHAPFHAPAARALQRAGQQPGRLHNNCSGKHAGMLALARHHGWPVSGYEKPGHPVQQRMSREIARWTGLRVEDLPTATDGCGVVTFALRLERLAGAFAGLAAAARRGEAGPVTVIGAMARFPGYVAGTDRLCTALIGGVDGRIVAKTGAEGVYCAAVPGAELGIALKVEDGSSRASEPALLAVLKTLGLLSDDEMAALSGFAEPFVMNTRGERVGSIRAVVQLEVGG